MHGSLQDQLIAKGLAKKEQSKKASGHEKTKHIQIPEMCGIDKTRLPEDTRDILRNSEREVPDNFALRLNRRVCFEKEKDKEKPVLPTYTDIDGAFNFDEKLIKETSDRQLVAIQDFGLERLELIFTVDWRQIVGLGNESVYETSITLHHVHGFPYIPASAVKGIIRSWIITEVFGETDDSVKKNGPAGAEARALDDEGFRAIFGDTKQVGKIKFFDAYPITKPKIDTDIMNPHFGDYYGDQTGETPPADYLTPVPVPFLTVKDTSFRFVLGIKAKENNYVPEGSRLGQGIMLLDVAGRWLKKALTEHGIGAKTAVGYGLMGSASKSS